MNTPGFDPANPLYKPLSIADAMVITGKSKRTIDRWIRDGRLHKVQLDGEPVLVEEEVLNYEKRMSDNLNASRTPTQSPSQPPT